MKPPLTILLLLFCLFSQAQDTLRVTFTVPPQTLVTSTQGWVLTNMERKLNARIDSVVKAQPPRIDTLRVLPDSAAVTELNKQVEALTTIAGKLLRDNAAMRLTIDSLKKTPVATTSTDSTKLAILTLQLNSMAGLVAAVQNKLGTYTTATDATEIITGKADGVNKVFVLSAIPLNGVKVFVKTSSATYYQRAANVTQSANKITFGSAPANGASILIDYLK